VKGLPSEPKKAFGTIVIILVGAVWLFALWKGWLKVLDFLGCRISQPGEKGGAIDWIYLVIFIELLWGIYKLLKK